jgi:hypothetical protein
MLVSNTVDMIKPIKKAALLHNKFAFRVFSREELRNFTDAKLNTSLIVIFYEYLDTCNRLDG